MLIDLGFITLIGCVLEALGTKFGSIVFGGAAPTFTFGLLFVFLAVVRWNLWGLLVVPFIALANFIGGKFISLQYIAYAYDWRLLLSTMIGLLLVGLNVILFKKKGTKKVLSNSWVLSGILVADYVLICAIELLFYRLLCSGTLAHSGQILYEYMDHSKNEMVTTNVCRFGEGGFVYNLFGFAVAVIGSFVLRSQGTLNNAISKLVEDREEAERVRQNDDNFSIVVDKSNNDADSSEVEESAEGNEKDSLDTKESGEK